MQHVDTERLLSGNPFGASSTDLYGGDENDLDRRPVGEPRVRFASNGNYTCYYGFDLHKNSICIKAKAHTVGARLLMKQQSVSMHVYRIISLIKFISF